MYNQPLRDASLIACPDCDLLQRLPALSPGASARCPRCDRELWRRRADSLNRTLALTLAAAVLYVVANAVPMLGLSAVGRQASTTVLGGARQLWNDGQQVVSASHDNTLKLWDLKTGELIDTFTADGPVNVCAITPDGNIVVAGDLLGRVHFLRIEKSQ